MNLKIPYTTKKIVVNKKNIKKFKRQQNARDLRKGKITQLANNISEEKHFDTGFVINQRKNQWRILDGNHRFEAIQSFLARNPNESIEIELHIYNELSDEEEKETYTRWNLGMKQTTSDFLKQYWEDINLIKTIEEKGFPIKISHANNKNNMSLYALLVPYLTRANLPYAGGWSGDALNFIQTIKGWNMGKKTLDSNGMDAYNTMKEFLKDYVACFGPYSSKSELWQQIVFFPMFRIWYENKHLPVEGLRTSLKKLTTAHGLQIIRNQAKSAGRENCQIAIRDYLSVINGSKIRNRLFITSKDSDGNEVKITGR